LAGSTSDLEPSTSASQESVLNLGKVKQAQVQGVQGVIDSATQQPIVPVSELGETLPPVIEGTPPEQPQLPIEQVTSPELTGPTRTEAQAAMGTTPWQGREIAELEFDAQDKAIREAATRRKETIFPRWMGVDIDPETGKLIKTKGTGLINNISFDIEEDLDAKEAIVNKDKKDIFPERIIDQVELGSEDTQERINQSAIDRQVNLSRGIIRNERKQNQLEKSLTKEDKDVIVDWAKKYEDKYFQDIDGLDKYETDASLDMDKLKNSLPEDISDFNKERIVNSASLIIQERYEEKKKQLETDRRMMELEDKAGLTESDEQMRKMRAGELPEGSQFAVELINVPGYKNPNLTQEEHDELMAYRKKKSTDRESYMLENQLIAKLGREDYNKRVDEEANSLYSEHELIEKKLVGEINELYDQEKPDYKKINALELKLSEFREAQAFVKGINNPLTAIDYMLSDTPTDDKVYDPVTKKRIGIEDASPALIDWNRRVDKAAIDFSRTNGVGDLKALQSRYYSEMKYLEKLGSEEEVQEAQASFMAVSKALDLNKSITNLQRNAWERTVEAVAEGIGFNYQSDEDEALAYTEALQDKGLKITDAEFDRVQQRFVDKLGSTVGGSIPVMMEIMFWTAVTQGTGMTTALETGLAKLGSRLAFGERSAKAINATAKVVSNAISREGQFQLAGEMGGAGESLGAEVGTSLAGNLAFLGNSKVGRILRTGFTQVGRAGGETIEEYSGELWSELMKDKSFADAFETVIGEDPLEKLALTYITGSIFAVGKVGTDFKNSKVVQEMGDVLLNYDGDNEIVNEAKKTAEAINQVKPGTQLEIDFEGKETDKKEFKGEDLLGREGDDREGDVVQVKEVEGELSNYTVDGKVRSDNQVIENLSDPEFVEKVKSGETNLDIQNPSPEVKTALEESGLLETKQDVKEEITPETKVDETPVEGEQQVTEDVVEEVTPERVVKEKKEVSIKPVDFEGDTETELDPYDASDKADKIAKDTGVGILRNKEIKSVATDSEGEVVGGLWTEVDGDSFSFDVAIDEKSQGQGVGEKLVNEAFQEFEFNADGNEELKYNIEVTNPSMEKLLSKYGFVVDERIGGTTKMSHPTNNPKLETKTKQDAKIKETKVDETKVEETKVLEEPNTSNI
jgi:ribosomal protein S18 acetylase RimI-like enzyme/copper chaperone CopZ